MHEPPASISENREVNPLPNAFIFCVQGSEVSWEKAFQAAGLNARAVALLQAVPLEDSSHRQVIQNILGSLEQMDWLVFGSRRGVQFFRQLLQAHSRTLPPEGKLSLGAVGEKTSRAIQQAWPRQQVDAIASNLQELLGKIATQSPAPQKVLNPTSVESLKTISVEVPAHLQFIRLPIYRLLPVQPAHFLLQLMERASNPPILCFTSPSSFTAALQWAGQPELIRRHPLAALGQSTARFIRQCGYQVAVLAPQPRASELARAVAGFLQQQG